MNSLENIIKDKYKKEKVEKVLTPELESILDAQLKDKISRLQLNSKISAKGGGNSWWRNLFEISYYSLNYSVLGIIITLLFLNQAGLFKNDRVLLQSDASAIDVYTPTLTKSSNVKTGDVVAQISVKGTVVGDISKTVDLSEYDDKVVLQKEVKDGTTVISIIAKEDFIPENNLEVKMNTFTTDDRKLETVSLNIPIVKNLYYDIFDFGSTKVNAYSVLKIRFNEKVLLEDLYSKVMFTPQVEGNWFEVEDSYSTYIFVPAFTSSFNSDSISVKISKDLKSINGYVFIKDITKSFSVDMDNFYNSNPFLQGNSLAVVSGGISEQLFLRESTTIRLMSMSKEEFDNFNLSSGSSRAGVIVDEVKLNSQDAIDGVITYRNENIKTGYYILMFESTDVFYKPFVVVDDQTKQMLQIVDSDYEKLYSNYPYSEIVIEEDYIYDTYNYSIPSGGNVYVNFISRNILGVGDKLSFIAEYSENDSSAVEGVEVKVYTVDSRFDSLSTVFTSTLGDVIRSNNSINLEKEGIYYLEIAGDMRYIAMVLSPDSFKDSGLPVLVRNWKEDKCEYTLYYNNIDKSSIMYYTVVKKCY